MILFEHVSKAFGDVRVLHDVDLRVDDGQIVGIAGPSGVGKTTVLKLIAGVLMPDGGRVTVDGGPVGYVFQEPRLLPWRTALDNVAVPLRAKGMGKGDAQRLAGHWLARVGLEGSEHLYPAELSGGMAQRVSIARALSIEPGILLLDEPFSAMDLARKGSVVDILREMIRERPMTVVQVTHDLLEAIQLADRIVYLSRDQPVREQDLSDRKAVAMEWLSETLRGLEG